MIVCCFICKNKRNRFDWIVPTSCWMACSRPLASVSARNGHTWDLLSRMIYVCSIILIRLHFLRRLVTIDCNQVVPQMLARVWLMRPAVWKHVCEWSTSGYIVGRLGGIENWNIIQERKNSPRKVLSQLKLRKLMGCGAFIYNSQYFPNGLNKLLRRSVIKSNRGSCVSCCH